MQEQEGEAHGYCQAEPSLTTTVQFCPDTVPAHQLSMRLLARLYSTLIASVNPNCCSTAWERAPMLSLWR